MVGNILKGGVLAAIGAAAICVASATSAPALTLSSSTLERAGASSNVEQVYYYHRPYGWRGGYGYRRYGYRRYGYGARCWINPYGVRVCRW